jgi:hypothetical protein
MLTHTHALTAGQAFILLSLGLLLVSGTALASYDCLGMFMFMTYFFVQDVTMLSELNQITWYNVVSVVGLHLVAVLGAWPWGVRCPTPAHAHAPHTLTPCTPNRVYSHAA